MNFRLTTYNAKLEDINKLKIYAINNNSSIKSILNALMYLFNNDIIVKNKCENILISGSFCER